jgi:hypothetical protein
MTLPPTPSEPTLTPTMREAGGDLLRRLHEVYHAQPDAELHLAPDPAANGLYQQPQPGTARFTSERLVGSAAPERTIERWEGVGPEGFGPVEILDGRTGKPLARLNSRNRGRLLLLRGE